MAIFYFCLFAFSYLSCYAGDAAYYPKSSKSSKKSLSKRSIHKTATKTSTIALTKAPTTTKASKHYIKVIKVEGSTVFKDDKIQSFTRKYQGKSFTFSELKELATKLTALYKKAGYVTSRAVIPKQDISNHSLLIKVIEAKIGKITFAKSGRGKVKVRHLKNIVAKKLKPGQILNSKRLEQALLLIKDVPGVRDASAEIEAGEKNATSDINIKIEQQKAIEGKLEFSNSSGGGGASTALARISVNNTIIGGDKANLDIARSINGNSKIKSASYTVPVNSYGTKATISHSRINYKLGKQFILLKAEGSVKTSEIALSHPLVKQKNKSLTASVSYSNKKLVNSTVFGKGGQGVIKAGTIGVSGSYRDGLLGGGVNQFSVTTSFSNLNLNRNRKYKKTDRSTARTSGNYVKQNLHLERTNRLTDSKYIRLAASGQITSKNLNPSEKYLIGGMGGVRSYPSSEMVGDMGYVVNLEYIHKLPAIKQIPADLTSVVFFDYGHLVINRRKWPGWSDNSKNLKNHYHLKAIGVGVGAAIKYDINIDLQYGIRLGNKPNIYKDKLKNQLWLKASKTM